MRWSRIKNIIIIILLLVNAALLAMVGVQSWRAGVSRRETGERMVAVLEQNGIRFLPGEVPGEMPLALRRVTLESGGEDQALALVGTVSESRTAGTRTTYVGERGEVTFSTAGEVEAAFAPGAWSRKNAEPAQVEGELLRALGVEGRESARESAGGRTEAVYTALWEGAPVPGVTLRLTWEGDDLVSLTGRRLTGEAESPPEPGSALDAATALARFLESYAQGGYASAQITGMYAGYAAGGTGTVTLTPAWYIETDTWDFTVDGYTGAVTAEG